jgi:hypothetical protein
MLEILCLGRCLKAAGGCGNLSFVEHAGPVFGIFAMPPKAGIGVTAIKLSLAA